MRVSNIFLSIDGEVNIYHQGVFTVFVRLAGCNLKCSYCDTSYSRDSNSGTDMDIDKVVHKIESFGCKKVTITGGEPMMQSASVLGLTRILWEKGYKLSIETNGTSPLVGFNVDCWVVDYKLSNSGIEKQIDNDIYRKLHPTDFVKFVLGNKNDYKEALAIKKTLQKTGCCAVFAFSPMHKVLDPSQLVSWLKKDKVFDCVINLQLHKYIWPNCGKGEER